MLQGLQVATLGSEVQRRAVFVCVVKMGVPQRRIGLPVVQGVNIEKVFFVAFPQLHPDVGSGSAEMPVVDQVRHSINAQIGRVFVQPQANLFAFIEQALAVVFQTLEQRGRINGTGIRGLFYLSGDVSEVVGPVTEEFDDAGGVAFRALIAPGRVQVRIGFFQKLFGLGGQCRQIFFLPGNLAAPFAFPAFVGLQDFPSDHVG